MLDNFNSGYTKCLVDMERELQVIKTYFPRHKVYQLNMITSLISYLLAHKDKRDLYRDTGGNVWIKTDQKGNVMVIADEKEKLKHDTV